MKQNEATACRYISKFGYLRNKDIARILFPELSSRERLAQRITKHLEETGALVCRLEGGNIGYYGLTRKGAAAAGAELGIELEHTVDAIRGIHAHRTAANEIAIRGLERGLEVVTEQQIQRSRLQHNGKVPDALLVDAWDEGGPELRQDYTWVEVENCERSGRDLMTLGNWLVGTAFKSESLNVLPELWNGYLAEVLVVIASDSARKIEQRLISYLWREYGPQTDKKALEAMIAQRLKFETL